MKGKNWLFGVVGALALGMTSAAAQASPLGGGAENLKATANENPAVQDVVWVRRCWRHHGNLHCRRVWYDGPYYYRDYPYDDGYYYGPGIGFWFGGSGHRHHHHHGGHHHHHR